MKDLSDAICLGKPTLLHYDIPEKYSTFAFDGDSNEKQLCAYIEIGLSNAEDEEDAT